MGWDRCNEVPQLAAAAIKAERELALYRRKSTNI